MRKFMVLMVGFICHSLTMQSQDAVITEKIQTAKQNGGIEYTADGQVKVAVNISKVEYYYKWVTTADTLSAYTTVNTLESAIRNSYVINTDENPDFISFSEIKAKYLKNKEQEKVREKANLAFENEE